MARLDPNDRNHVEYYVKTKLNKRKSEEEGRPVHDEVEMIWIRFPGDNKMDHHAPAHSKSIKVNGYEPTYAERYPDEYELFKKGRAQKVAGTPLGVAPFLSAAKVRDLEAMNVFTVEALADLDGAFLKRLGMGARKLKDEAVKYLADSKDVAQINKLSKANAEMGDELAALRAELEKLKKGDVSRETNVEQADDTPFDDMDDDSIRLWMTDQGGKPDGRWSRQRLLDEANQLNMQIKLQNERAA